MAIIGGATTDSSPTIGAQATAALRGGEDFGALARRTPLAPRFGSSNGRASTIDDTEATCALDDVSRPSICNRAGPHQPCRPILVVAAAGDCHLFSSVLAAA